MTSRSPVRQHVMAPRTNSKTSSRHHRKTLKQKFPPGWTERKVRAVIQRYERLTEDELAHEIETAPEVTDETLISVPTALSSTIKQLIVRHRLDVANTIGREHMNESPFYEEIKDEG